MMSWKPWIRALGIAFVAAAAAPTGAAAQAYPERVVKVIANQPPGGASDMVTRLVADALSESFGKTFIVENRGGASGAIGLETVAHAAPDGHTLLVSASTIAINPAISGNTTYSLERDLTPIAQVATGPYMIVVTPAIPAEDARQLADHARKTPGGLRWGLSNIGAGDHLAIALFDRMAEARALFVPYKGAGPALTGILSGEVDAVMFPVSVVLPQVKGGKLKAVAVTGARRIEAAPEVKTVAEAGFPGFEFETWFGLWGPRGLSPERVAVIRDGLARGLADPRIKDRLSRTALTPGDLDTARFAAFVSTELAKYRRIADENQIRAE